MRRGDVYWADLDPTVGSEAGKVRPVVLVGRDAHIEANRSRDRGVLTVVPLTSNVSRVLSFQVFVPAGTAGLDRDSKAQAEQIRSVDVARLRDRVGALPPGLRAALDAALRLHLAL